MCSSDLLYLKHRSREAGITAEMESPSQCVVGDSMCTPPLRQRRRPPSHEKLGRAGCPALPALAGPYGLERAVHAERLRGGTTVGGTLLPIGCTTPRAPSLALLPVLPLLALLRAGRRRVVQHVADVLLRLGVHLVRDRKSTRLNSSH